MANAWIVKKGRRMKKILPILMILLLVACVPAAEEEVEGLHIVTASFPLYDFARELVGEDARVEILLPPGSEVHSYEITPGDIKKVTGSDLFLYIGGSSDTWINNMVDASELEEKQSLRLMDVVDLYKEEESQSMVEEEDDHADHEEEYDEHIWLSFENSKRMVEAIAKAMGELDLEEKDNYIKRAREYNEKIEALEDEYLSMVSSAKRKEIIVGDRFPFLYLVKSLGISYDAAYPGCSAHVEENAQAIKGLIDRVEEEDIPVVFYIEMSRGTIADRIAEATGAKKRMLHSVQNVTKEEMQAGEGYLSLMEKNLAVLEEALN